MAAELIAGAFISGAIELLLERIASPDFLNYFLGNRGYGFDRHLAKLADTLSSISAVLEDAERIAAKVGDDPKLVAWLDKVEEAVFDADDLFDDIEDDLLQQKVETQFGAGTSEVRGSKRQKIVKFISRFVRLREREVERKVNEIVDRLGEIVKEREVFCLKEDLSEVKPWKRTPSTSLVAESDVCGRDSDKDLLIKMLLSDDESGNLSVIPIVGMGGIGKTTIAQAVFMNEKVTEHFQLKAWVCVSQEYDPLRVTKGILMQVSQLACDDAMDLNSVQVKLWESLFGKKFLIVLDDVWSENYLDWDYLRRPFVDGAQGSKIIVTTRSNKVANVMGTVGNLWLGKLRDEACWQIFARGVGDLTTNPDMEQIGRAIVEKCKGLPLGVKVLGGLLRSTSDVQEWERVSTSDIWELTEIEIPPALRLSYDYLHAPLKRCFAYCSIFPNDYKFDKEELILLWMGENLLQDPNGNKKMEDVGVEYFDELVSRSFLRSINTDGKSFVMHDLVVDLAKHVSRNCLSLDSCGSSKAHAMRQVRYLSYTSHMYNSKETFDFVSSATKLRTFLTLQWSGGAVSKDTLHDLFSKLRSLRVLSFSGYKYITEVPDSIGGLRHLRYLNLSDTFIRCLPKTIVTLYSLQTLKLAFCKLLQELPNDFHRLISLRYLDISDTRIEVLPRSLSLMSSLRTLLVSRSIDSCMLKDMPKQISKLKNLERLSTFIVGRDAGRKIRELGELPNLRGALHIMNLQNMVKPEDALEAKLREKEYLEELMFGWAGNFDVTDGPMHHVDVLDNLKPNPRLKVLRIFGYGGKKFPNWVGNESFCNIVDIKLSHCNHCVTLPPLGRLLALKRLYISRFDALVNVGPEFYGNSYSMMKPFPSLEVLNFHCMHIWKQWLIPDGYVEAFPKLRKLSLDNCPKISSLDNLPPSLESLDIIACLEFESFPIFCLPSTLQFLKIENCDKLVASRRNWNLQRLPNLTNFEIQGSECENMVSFPEAGLLPSTVTQLHLGGIKCLKILNSKGLQQLNSLKGLSIGDCENLQILPNEGLPLSLESLTISRCPLVGEKCARKTGEYWNKIAHIPKVFIQ